MLTRAQARTKRIIDFSISLIMLLIIGWFVIVLIAIVFLLTGEKGLFRQKRIGQYGHIFTIYKIRSIYRGNKKERLTKVLRKYKLDELPQLYNILIGEMSFVGPRPDIEGYADTLQGEERIILSIKPGLTGPASLFFFNEEELLSEQVNKEHYNREVIWKKKIKLNMKYIQNYSIQNDMKYLNKTLFRYLQF